MHVIHIQDREERERIGQKNMMPDKKYIQTQKMKGSGICCNIGKHTSTSFFLLLNDFKAEVFNQEQFYPPGHIWQFLETFFCFYDWVSLVGRDQRRR